MLRMMRPLSGILPAMPKALSRFSVAAMPCDCGQTPQMRWVIIWASRGSRPRRIISRPRKRLPVARAALTTPFSTTHSILRCPSILVTGSITILPILGLLVGPVSADDGQVDIDELLVKRRRLVGELGLSAAVAGRAGADDP